MCRDYELVIPARRGTRIMYHINCQAAVNRKESAMELFDLINLTSPGTRVEIVVFDLDENDHTVYEVIYEGIALYYPHDFDTQEVMGIDPLKNGTLRIIL